MPELQLRDVFQSMESKFLMRNMTVHTLYPTIDTNGMITRSSRIMAFVFVILVPAIAAAGATVLGVLGMVTWTDLGIFTVMYVLTATGITVGYHRLFTHRAFEAPRPVRWILAALGCMNAQGAPIVWAAQHRSHHASPDQAGDPHSPHQDRKPGFLGALTGVWHSHYGHVFNQKVPIEPERFARDLTRDPFLLWLEKRSALFVVLGMLLPFGAGWLLSGSWIGGLTGHLWGGWVRLFVATHATGSVNSLCHVFGSQRFDIKDRSGNVGWLVPLTLGESWHHNHHAFPTSARQGLKWWEFDPSWIVIWTMEKLGLARNVTRVSRERQEQKLAVNA
jgi:stearoyl-CoA desaturase (delta-9 desaturase)